MPTMSSEDPSHSNMLIMGRREAKEVIQEKICLLKTPKCLVNVYGSSKLSRWRGPGVGFTLEVSWQQGSPQFESAGHMVRPCLRKLKCFKCYESRSAMKNSCFYLEKLPFETFCDPLFWIILPFQCRIFSFVDTMGMKCSEKKNLWFIILRILES